ncbi:MAG: type IV toxin-antitoxin system AbiEi family antitoxin domain-containing protein [Phycisphaerales bacterium]|jgi:hypothetical protein
MSDYARIAQMLAEGIDPSASVRYQYLDGRPFAWAYRNDGEGGDEILALGGGDDATSAWRMLLRVLARDDRALSTQEAAQALGVDDSRVRRFALAGRLVPLSRGVGTAASRFAPGEVHRFAGLARRRGMGLGR